MTFLSFSVHANIFIRPTMLNNTKPNLYHILSVERFDVWFGREAKSIGNAYYNNLKIYVFMDQLSSFPISLSTPSYLTCILLTKIINNKVQ